MILDNHKIFTPSPALLERWQEIRALRGRSEPIPLEELRALIQRLELNVDLEKEIGDRASMAAYLFREGSDNLDTKTVDARFERFNIGYFYVHRGIGNAGLTEIVRDPNRIYEKHLDSLILGLEQELSPTDETRANLQRLKEKKADLKNPNDKITADENGHHTLAHIFVLEDRETGQRYFFGQDDLETLFKDQDHLIERIILESLVQQRNKGVNYHKSRLNILERILFIDNDESRRNKTTNDINLLRKIKNDYFTDDHIGESERLIDTYCTIWDSYWTSQGKNPEWLNGNNLPHFLTALREMERINRLPLNNGILGLLGNADEVKARLSTGLALVRAEDASSPENLSSAVDFITSSYEKLLKEQRFQSYDHTNPDGSVQNESTAKHYLATVRGQAAISIGSELNEMPGNPKVTSFSLSDFDPLEEVLKAIPKDGNPLTVTYVQANASRPLAQNHISGDLRTDTISGSEPKSDVVVVNCLFEKMNNKKEEIINAVLNIRRQMKQGSTLKVVMRNQHQLSKSTFEEAFRAAGFETVSCQVEKNERSEIFHELTRRNPSAKGIVNKSFEVTTLKLKDELPEDEIRSKLDALPPQSFTTRNSKKEKTYGSREITDDGYVLNPNYLKALALLNRSTIADQFIPTSSELIPRSTIIQNENNFEESLACLLFLNSTEYGGVELLTEHQSDMLHSVLHMYDEKLSSHLTSTQVDFIQRAPHLITCRIDSLPENIRETVKPSNDDGDRCTLWEAYVAERNRRSSASPSEQSVLDQVRPRKTLAAKIQYALDYQLRKYADQYGRPQIINFFGLPDSSEQSKLLQVASLPTGQARGLGYICLNPYDNFLPGENTTCRSVTTHTPMSNQQIISYYFPSPLISLNELPSYFKEGDGFKDRLNAYVENGNFPRLALDQELQKQWKRASEDQFTGRMNLKRLEELMGAAEPTKEEVVQLFQTFYNKIVTNEDELLVLDPLYKTRKSINNLPKKQRKEIVDDVEFKLAVLEKNIMRLALYDDSLLYTEFQRIKKAWDEDFIQELPERDYRFLDVVAANFKDDMALSGGHRITFTNAHRPSLNERLKRKGEKIVAECRAQYGGLAPHDALSEIQKKYPDTSRHITSVSGFAYSWLEFSSTDFIVPRVFIPHAQLADCIPSHYDACERLRCFATNDNSTDKGLIGGFDNTARAKKLSNFLVDNLTKFITREHLILLPEVTEKLAKHFEVQPQDIDPNYKPRNNFPNDINPILLTDDRKNWRPLEDMSIEERMVRYEYLPRDIERRDLNETVLVELVLAVLSNPRSFREDNTQQLLDNISREWNEEFRVTLSSERRKELIQLLNSNCSTDTGSGVQIIPLRESIRLVEEQRKTNTNPSYVFKNIGPKTLQKEIEKRAAKYTYETIQSVTNSPHGDFKTLYRFRNFSHDPNIAFHVHYAPTTPSDPICVPADLITPTSLANRFTPINSLQQRILLLLTNRNFKTFLARIDTSTDSDFDSLAKSILEKLHETNPQFSNKEIKFVAGYFNISVEELIKGTKYEGTDRDPDLIPVALRPASRTAPTASPPKPRSNLSDAEKIKSVLVSQADKAIPIFQKFIRGLTGADANKIIRQIISGDSFNALPIKTAVEEVVGGDRWIRKNVHSELRNDLLKLYS